VALGAYFVGFNAAPVIERFGACDSGTVDENSNNLQTSGQKSETYSVSVATIK